MGFDVSNDMVQQTRTKLQQEGYDDTINRVHKVDVLVDPNGARQLVKTHFAKARPSVVFIDIGGNRNVSSVIRVLHWTISTYSPRLVVIKNWKLVQECTSNVFVDSKNDMLVGAHEWFCHKHHAEIHTAWPNHPLQAPMVLSPTKHTIPICRYHNYHEQGCKKADAGECPFDHDHCHTCQQQGHTAKECPMRRKE
jgi:hypothetical protein